MLCTRILRQQASQGKKNAVAVQHMCGTANFRWMGHSLAGSFAVRFEDQGMNRFHPAELSVCGLFGLKQIFRCV